MPNLGEPLSDRELEVLECLSQGATNKEIAAELVISQNTVKVHLRNVYTKLGVSSRTEATTVALQQGMLTIPGVEVTAPEEESVKEDNAAAQASELAATAFSPPTDTHPTPAVELSPNADVATAPPKSTGWLSWRTGTLLLAIVIVSLVGFIAFQSLTATPAFQDETPFEETAVTEDNKWFLSRPLPEPRSGMALAATGLNIYQFGGETASGVDQAAYRFDTTLQQWQQIADKPTAVTNASAAVLFGEIYLVGGRLDSGEATAVVEAYSPANDRWRVVASLPEPIQGGLLLTDGSFLYLFGGQDGETFLATVYRFDPANPDGWNALPTPMSFPRSEAAGGYLTGQFYVVGGKDETGALTACEFFDVDLGWSTCPEMTQGRAGAEAAVLLNQLYVLGGEGSDVSDSEVYNPNSELWQIIDTPAMDEGLMWPDLGVTTVEMRIYAVGGRVGDDLSGNTYQFRPIFQTFIPTAPQN